MRKMSDDISILSVEVKSLVEFRNATDDRCVDMENQLRLLKDQTETLIKTAGTTSMVVTREGGERDYEIIIDGFGSISRDKLLFTIERLAAVIAIDFQKLQIANCYQLHLKNNKHPIIVKFISTFTRDSWLRGKRAKGDIYANEIDVDYDHVKIYINERSTKSEREVFAAAKKIAIEHGYQYVWMKRGIVFVRETAQSPYIRITCLNDLQTKLNLPNVTS